MVDDAERRYGASRFVEIAPASALLGASRYLHALRALDGTGPLRRYPGSPLLAMQELGTECSYVFCDLAGESTDDLRQSSERLGVSARVVGTDGMSALHERQETIDDARHVFAHVDPYDPHALGPAGLSALDLAVEVAARGAGIMYWYGYSRPDERAWAFDELAGRSDGSGWWCGDMLVESTGTPRTEPDGDLGDATTPGTGFGIVTANVSTAAVAACAALGAALAAAYEGAPLPDGRPGRLDFTTRS